MRTLMLAFLLFTGLGTGGCIVHEERPRARPVVVERVYVPGHYRDDRVWVEGYYR